MQGEEGGSGQQQQFQDPEFVNQVCTHGDLVNRLVSISYLS